MEIRNLTGHSSTIFSTKSFDFVLDIGYSYGNDVLNMTMHSGEDRTGLANSYRSVLNAWTETNQSTDIAAVRDSKAGYVSNVDTHWIEDGSLFAVVTWWWDTPFLLTSSRGYT